MCVFVESTNVITTNTISFVSTELFVAALTALMIDAIRNISHKANTLLELPICFSKVEIFSSITNGIFFA
jgi:hypothetical protein